jgi:uncharacterized protein YjbI with pentapeptide repeats
MAEEKSKEQREAEWWSAWRREDFSWHGLASKLIGQTVDMMMQRHSEDGPVGLHGEKSLQDYWRHDPESGNIRDDQALFAAGELIKAPNGEAWHIVHTPLYWQGGGPAKADWDAAARNKLANCIAARITAGVETKVDRYGERAPEGPDGRAQLAGAVLLDPPTNPKGKSSEIHLDAPAAWFPAWDASDQSFGPGARFDRAFFSEGAYFARAKFSGVARFEMATFSESYGSPWFAAAVFSGYVTFYHAIFCGTAEFGYATFLKGARIEKAIFFGNAGFGNVTFSGDVSLGATFHGNAVFGGTTFSDGADFLGPKFSEAASFKDVTFSGDVSFYEPIFSGEASFEGANFSGCLHFKMPTFSGEANFEGGLCEKMTTFDCARFEKTARFGTREFAGLAYFDGSHFAGPMQFGAAVFEKPVSFRRITWPNASRDWHAAFDQTLFGGTAVFKDSGFRALAAFDGATFERGIQIDDVSETIASGTFEAERRGAIGAASVDASEWMSAEEKRRREADKDAARPITSGEISMREAESRDLRLKQLERGCRVLKQAMEKASNKTREQLLHRFELIARRSQRDTPLWESVFSHVYELTSNYGGSIARPLGVLLLMLIPGFAALYWGWGAALARLYPAEAIGLHPIEDAWAALRFAWTNAFHPFSALASNIAVPGESSWLAALLSDFGPGWGFAVRAVATLQSVASLVLIFLSGLAVRRRFQIS